MKKKNPIYGDSLMVERNKSLFFCTPISLYAISMELFLLEHLSFCKGNSSFSGLKLQFQQLGIISFKRLELWFQAFGTLVSNCKTNCFLQQKRQLHTVMKSTTSKHNPNHQYKGDSIIAITVLSPTAVTSLSIYNLIVIVKSVTDDKYILLFNLQGVIDRRIQISLISSCQT